MNMNQKKIEAILSLPGPKRYDHFIKVVADERHLWGLFSDGWALAATSEGGNVFPVWPAKEYAALCATRGWQEFKPKKIGLDEFFEELLPRLNESGTGLAVFYTPDDRGITPDLKEIERDLRSELARIE